MRIQCWNCGGTRIVFSRSGDKFGKHHGARCAHCMKPISLRDCLFITYEIELREEELRKREPKRD